MKDDMFEQLLESVQQADEIISGKTQPSRIAEFAEPQVKDIRSKMGLTESRFADILGVSKRTLENWEQGRRHPTGPARALLKMLDKDPEFVLQSLS